MEEGDGVVKEEEDEDDTLEEEDLGWGEGVDLETPGTPRPGFLNRPLVSFHCWMTGSLDYFLGRL